MKSVLFVDGENLTLRYQQMKKDGHRPLASVIHRNDIFLWVHAITGRIEPGLYRANYYTSVVGDEPSIESVKKEIASTTISVRHTNYHEGSEFQLNPCVYKKDSRSQKTRLVDINIVIDVMRYCYTDAVDRIYLFSGDGDYLDLIRDIMKTGKQVCLGALSSGLSPPLKYSVDKFIDLDRCFFETRDAS